MMSTMWLRLLPCFFAQILLQVALVTTTTTHGDGLQDCSLPLPPHCSSPSPTPVCGSDLRTYPSLCLLQRAGCAPSAGAPAVTVRHWGRCHKCQRHRKQAMKQKAAYLPQCTSLGAYKPVQCYRGTGFCWCVDDEGNHKEGVVVGRRCEKKGKSLLSRRSPRRNPRRVCSLTDKKLFNQNLIEKFQTEYQRIHDISPIGDPDRQVLDWKFLEMDRNRDGRLDKTEYRDLKKLVKKFVKPKRCSRSFAQACDMDRDQVISSQEWRDCLTRDGMNADGDSRPDSDSRSMDESSDPDYDEQEDLDYGDFTPNARRSPIESSLVTSHLASSEDSDPPTEESVDCLTDRQSVLNEQRADNLYVPECTPDGRYKKIQCYSSVGYCWCVYEDTGKVIPGTAVQRATPKCDQVPVSTRAMKGCPEPKKTVFLKELMQFLQIRMVQGANDTNITGGAWQASLEEKAATWNFVVLDKNKNKVLERKEWKVFRSLVSNQKQLKRCGKKLPRYCDVNSDQKISLTEWLECLNTKRNTPGTQAPKQPSQRTGQNPLRKYLSDD